MVAETAYSASNPKKAKKNEYNRKNLEQVTEVHAFVYPNDILDIKKPCKSTGRVVWFTHPLPRFHEVALGLTNNIGTSFQRVRVSRRRLILRCLEASS